MGKIVLRFPDVSAIVPITDSLGPKKKNLNIEKIIWSKNNFSIRLKITIMFLLLRFKL